ncbi:Putative auto-transporter adhesin, head GIN domain [Mucilaginibacter sp. OK268]|uniref:head GIN domain-containing protein n=1 Tax=Mucilaginibacter sp. OK268 TaxID=1881048 RepID=UPI0008858A58|nr:head GIN domain-containing protein [Mucilaginibacter sp. OK268]SDP78893.1 Putative auto-transporter adhesin, head GIN domain [Mucilaginibacter sp. OK268]
MKKTGLVIAIIACASLSIISSCKLVCVHGSGKIITEQRKATDFSRIDISGAYKIHLKQDSSLSISVTGDDNLLKYVSTSVNGGKLVIKTTKTICLDDSLVVNIGIRKLEELKSSGAVEVSSTGKITTGDLNIHLSGATKVNLDLNAANVNSHGSGVSELNLTGQAATHQVEFSGVGKINAFDFVVGEYTINSSGASHCKINVLKTLNVHSSGASEIRYKGSPTTVNNDKSGASSIEKVD